VAELVAPRFPATACFHAQQSAEKALKAILYSSGERVVLGHSLAALGEAVQSHSGSFAELAPEVSKLDRYYIPTRYPNSLPEGTDPSSAFDGADAAVAMQSAAAAVQFARGFLSSD